MSRPVLQVRGRQMQKQQRDEVFSSISAEETTIYRDLIREVRAQRKASSTGQFTAREVLGPRMDGLPSGGARRFERCYRPGRDGADARRTAS